MSEACAWLDILLSHSTDTHLDDTLSCGFAAPRFGVWLAVTHTLGCGGYDHSAVSKVNTGYHTLGSSVITPNMHPSMTRSHTDCVWGDSSYSRMLGVVKHREPSPRRILFFFDKKSPLMWPVGNLFAMAKRSPLRNKTISKSTGTCCH